MGPPDVAGSRRGKDEPPTVRDKRFSSRTDGGFPLPHRAWPGRVGQARVTMKGSGLLQVIAIPINRWRRVEVIGLLQDSGGRGGGKGCGVSRSLRSA
jgi:hypothetical protein